MATSAKKRSTKTTRKAASPKVVSTTKPSTSGAAAETTVQPTYVPWSRPIPPNPSVRIIFHGLQSFFFAGKSSCRVGVVNHTQGTVQPHPHPHDFNITLWIVTDTGQCTRLPLIPQIGNPKLLRGVEIKTCGVSADVGVDGVYVFQSPNGFSRPAPPAVNHPNDWGWVLDVESDLFYPEGVDNITDTINPHVSIDNGLFYTLKRAERDFLLHPDDGSGDKPLGHVAEIVAANIYLDPGGQLELKITPRLGLPLPVSLRVVPGVTYEIDITNNCRHGNQPCEFRPHRRHPKEERNDFYLYYGTFRRPAGKPEYELICGDCPDRGRTDQKEVDRVLRELGICYDPRGPVIDSNNEAPCSVIGHGQSSDPNSP